MQHFKKGVWLVLLFASVVTARAQSGANSSQTKPNIIFILVDDMGWGDVGAFWQKQRAQANDRSEPWQFTPSLDAIANQGVMLTNHYCAAPVCAPSRASLMLGVHQGHANVRNNQFDKALQETYTMPSVLKQAGYHTSLVGKWGLQGLGAEAPNWPAHPLNRGFDYSYAYIRHVDGHEHYPVEGIYRGKKEVWENKNNVTAGLAKSFTTDLWTAKAKQIITEQARQKDKPFFMYLAYDVPHAVIELPTQAYPTGKGLNGGLKWLGKSGQMINTASGKPDSYLHPDYANATYDHDKNPATAEVAWPNVYKRYATLCRRIDDGIGDIMQLLKDLNIDKNTLVVFTSDNGPSIESYLDEPYEPTFFNSFGPHDGIKRDVWEGGVRVPTLVQWPGTIAADRVISSPSAMYDWLATFADAAGLLVPARSDGVSLLPQLTGTGTQRPGIVYIEYENNGTTPGFDEFAPAHRKRRRNQMQKLRLGDFVGVRYNIQSAGDDFEIYNVVTDPQETRNLAKEEEYAYLQKAFKDKSAQWRRPDTEAPRPYDLAPMAGVEPQNPAAGVKWMVHEGDFPWVADLSARTPTATGVMNELNLKDDISLKEGMVYLEGYLKVPAEGTYQFTLSGNGGYLMKLHEAMVIDRSYLTLPKGNVSVSGTALLKAGYHPFRIYYHKESGAKPALNLSWQGPGLAEQSVSADYLFH